MTLSLYSDEYYMREALKQARYALEEEEIPIGAVVVLDRQIIARAYNQTEKLRDVTAHAEMLALTAAANHLGNKYLQDCTLYVTVEPCVMCAGASFWAQVKRVVYGAAEDKRGYRRYGNLLHPRTELATGIMALECAALMQEFFARKRK
ncbi:nucleoside deaminase [Hymenobacter lutimineralis]|uniref:tRNA-specific adenosine deaminase n=1 Tax=Hymenobacter lutimineralis TaxID=2606448 RepID=A0A5D6V4P0_9BACT|nr:nucleoside deaminase [Hymenobacter lutimineralis]TYZ10115.1 nucleoside deaminase [Hymenobacter lutimineralis]